MLQRSGKQTGETGLCQWTVRALDGAELQLFARLYVHHVRRGDLAGALRLDRTVWRLQQSDR